MSGQPRADQLASAEHFHTADSPCLERVPEIPTMEYREGERVMAPAEHWYRCTHLRQLERTSPWRGEYTMHEHGTALHAHEFLNSCVFPA